MAAINEPQITQDGLQIDMNNAGISRIGVCSWSLGPNTPIDLIEALKQLEINSVQLALGPMLENPLVWGAAIEEIRQAGLQVSSGMMATMGEDYCSLDSIARTGGIRPDETWQANRNLAQRVADLAAKSSIDLVTFHGGFIPEDRNDPEHAKLLDRFRIVADIFKAQDVKLGLETGQESAQTLIDVLEDLDHPNIGVNFDPANMILYGKGEPVEALKLLSSYIVQIHVKDALPTETPGTWGREVPAGQGTVNWAAFFDVAHSIDPPVNFIIEREAGADRKDDIAAARDLIAYHIPAQ